MLETLGNVFNLIFSVNFILTVITASTPLLLASSGELIVERSGVLNLGVEGMMIVGAACGFAGAWISGSIAVGALCGVLAGMAMAAVFGVLTLGLAVNQVATGLALTIFGIGLSGLIGASFVGEKIVPAPHLDLPVLTGLPGRSFIFPSPSSSPFGCSCIGPAAVSNCAPLATIMPPRTRSAIRF